MNNFIEDAAEDPDLPSTEEQPEGSGGGSGAGTSLPAVRYRTTTAVAVLADSESPEAESIHTLRTHLAATHVREGRRGLAICASDGNADPVFVAVNLAVSFARAGLRTLLVDADMRRPGVHRLIIPSREVPSLREVLEDPELPLGDAIQDDVLPHLSVIYAGGHAENAQELLASPRFEQIIDLCLRDFDMTIVTTPPSNQCADARRIASVLRHAIIVARKDKTYLSDVNVLMNELQGDGARVIGSIFKAF